MLKLISDLVSFETVYPNYIEFEKCLDYIKSFFENTSLHIKEYLFEKEKSIVISNTTSKDLDIIFCGHIDVVPAESHLFKVVQKGDIIYGRGVSDMKGQVAVMMQLMKEIDTDKKVALFLTPDEERGGFNGCKKLLEEGYTCKVAFTPDGGFDYGLVTEEKGVLQLKVSAKGVECHSSELYKGENAIVKLFDIYNKLIEKYPLPQNENEWRTSVNLAKMEGGGALNKVPGEAAMYLDIRHIHADKKESIMDYIKKLSEDITVEVLAEGETYYVDPENQFVRKYIEVCESVLGQNIKAVNCPSASDGRFFTARNIPCIMMNPIGGNIHCKDEYVSLESLGKLLEIYKMYVGKM